MAGMTYTAQAQVDLSTAEIYGRVLTELAAEHEDIVGLSADLAKSTKIGLLGDKFPERFFNVGIAEQDMMGIAAGLAAAGFTPFVSTFAAFASMRACEQVRTDICYNKKNVKIIATHTGTSFGQAGTTHHCTEDIAIMRSFAGMVVLNPADGMSTAQAVEAAYEHDGPVYIRINRGFDQVVYEEPIENFRIGGSNMLREGTDLTIIACGAGVWRAVQAADFLKNEDGLSVRVIDLYSLKPLDEEAIKAAVGETRRIVTVEDHNIIGGMGSAVADVAATAGKGFTFKKLGVPDCWSIIGQPEDLMSYYGFDENGIIETVRELMKIEVEEDDDWDDEV